MKQFFEKISLSAEVISWDEENILIRMEGGEEISWPRSRCSEAFLRSLQTSQKVELILMDDATFEEERTRIAKAMLNEILRGEN